MSEENARKNILLKEWKTPFATPPFEEIREEDFLPALRTAIKESLEEIEGIASSPRKPDFENTVEALEYSGEKVERIATVFFNLNSAETNPHIQKIAREFSPLLSEYANDIMLHSDLFERVKEVWNQREDLSLGGEEKMLLEKTYKAFVRNGAHLPEKKKIRLRAIDRELSELSLHFGENVLADTQNFEMVISREEELEGLPESTVEAARETAKEKGLGDDKWAFTLDFPSYQAFMTYSSRRHLREKLFRAFGSRGSRDNKHNNADIIRRIVALRQERAELLGFSTHAEYVLEERMLQSPEKVDGFLNELLGHAKPAGKEDIGELREYARKEGIEELQRWDQAYFSEKLKKEKYEVDDEMLKPYFRLEDVIKGVFSVAEKLYGIQFEQRDDIPKYHKDVKTYEVKDSDGSHLAVFLADFFPRPGKRSGAWMTIYRQAGLRNGKEERPIVSIVCNFTKPTSTKPSLLTFNEVTTLFHEFGHALHGILGRGKYPSLTGTNVYWDFVELPSQIMENWCFRKECLDLFARHYRDDSPIPEDIVERLRKSSTFMEGSATLRQLGLGMLDMAYHHKSKGKVKEVEEFEEEVMQKVRLLPHVPNTNISCSFGHIFQGGYSAGYYSYKWSEVLDADAFERFEEEGIFSEKVASDFRKLLEAGGSVHPAELYRRFRGNDPDPKALLRRAGLLKDEKQQ